MEEFNHVVEELGLMDDDGITCYMDQHLNDSSKDDYDHDHHHDHDDHDDRNHDHYDDDDSYNDYDDYRDYEDVDDHDNATNCSTMYEVCRNLILEIGLTSEACLAGNGSSSGINENEHNDISDSEGKTAKYFSLNYIFILLCSIWLWISINSCNQCSISARNSRHCLLLQQSNLQVYNVSSNSHWNIHLSQ